MSTRGRREKLRGVDRRTILSSPVSVLIVTLELIRVNRSACGCNPNLNSTVHLAGNCRIISGSLRFKQPTGHGMMHTLWN